MRSWAHNQWTHPTRDWNTDWTALRTSKEGASLQIAIYQYINQIMWRKITDICGASFVFGMRGRAVTTSASSENEARTVTVMTGWDRYGLAPRYERDMKSSEETAPPSAPALLNVVVGLC